MRAPALTKPEIDALLDASEKREPNGSGGFSSFFETLFGSTPEHGHDAALASARVKLAMMAAALEARARVETPLDRLVASQKRGIKR